MRFPSKLCAVLLLCTIVISISQAANVVVVGAGFAGLGAATELERSGHTVTVVEGRTRIGGRAFTDTTSFGDPVDLGAMWIHGITANPVYQMAQALGIKTEKTNYDNLALFAANGSQVADEPVEKLYDQLTIVLDKIRNKADNDISVGAAMEKAFTKMGLSKQERDLMRFKICDEVELDYATSVYNLSGWWYDDDDYLKGGDVMVTDSRGYASIVDAIARNLTQLHLNTTVHQIEYNGDSHQFKLATNQGTMSALDYVVVTASLGVLKRGSIDFQPELPKNLRHAVQKMNCDVSDKTVLQFPAGSAKTWNGTALDVFYHLGEEPSHHGEFTENWNMDHYSRRDMIMSFSVGPRDWALLEASASTNQSIATEALAALRTAYGDLPDPTRVVSHRWGNDPYAACTWSSWGVGSSPKDTKTFLEGVHGGRLVFAGEHTTKSHPGTTHGAWNTGISAAKAIDAAEYRWVEREESLPQEVAARLRTEFHTPTAQNVMTRRPFRSKRKEWGRQLQQARRAPLRAPLPAPP